MIEAYAKKRDEFYVIVRKQRPRLIALFFLIVFCHLILLPTIISHKSMALTIIDSISLICMDFSMLSIIFRYIRAVNTLKGSVFNSDIIDDIDGVDSVLKNMHKKYMKFGVYESATGFLLELQQFDSWQTVLLLIDKSKLADYSELAEMMKIVSDVKFKSERAEAKPYWYMFNQYLYVNDTTPKIK